jgi:transposase-like protein
MHLDMLKNSVENVKIEIVCGTCGTGQSKPIGYFRNHSHLTCDGCGSEITVENEQFRASIAEFGRAMARLREPYLH